MTSYVDIAFEILEWNENEAMFRELYARFMSFAALFHTRKDGIRVEFELTVTDYLDRQFRGFALSLWTHGYGVGEDEARERWAAGMETVRRFFAGESKIWSHVLGETHTTIS